MGVCWEASAAPGGGASTARGEELPQPRGRGSRGRGFRSSEGRGSQGKGLLQPRGEGRAALPKVDSPDVLLDARCGVQHLATVFPKAFEHHLHGVLQEGGKTASQCKQSHPVSSRPFPFPSLEKVATRHVPELHSWALLAAESWVSPVLPTNQALLLISVTFTVSPRALGTP